jgi:predicted ATPase/class 3 adenylate cyclase
MSTRSETFGRLLKGAINSIAAYEGKIAPAIEEDLGAQIGLAGSALQRYKAGNLPPEPRTIEILATAAVRRGYLGRAWLQAFLQAARYPGSEHLIAQLVPNAPGTAAIPTTTSSLPHGTITFLFTDIAGSTELWEQQPQAMQRALARHDALVRQAIEQQRGIIFKTVGDAFCAAFATAPDALAAAIAAQRAVQAEAWETSGLASSESIRVRMALHAGAAETRDRDYFGPSLNRTARLCAAGAGGQILVSRTVHELVRDYLSVDTDLRDLGEHRLKDLARPEQIFQVIASGLSAVFPPLKTLNTSLTNLPIQPNALIGREHEVETITDLLHQDDVRLLTLTGPGGIGKTRLAMQAATELVDRFVDGVWFVGLAPISDPALIPGVIAQTLGVQEHSDRTIADMLAAYLRTKQLLLLLDNFEQVVAAAPVLADLLAAAPRLKLLVTSREMLNLYGEHEYAVPPLVLPQRTPLPPLEQLTQSEAVRLFIERARAVKADFAITNQNAPAVAEICYRLDGLPLAIELAAARSKIFSPQALLARLDRRLTFLSGGARNLPARQQTLRGAIDWSYELLDAGEQELFARLGVFVGGCTLEAAQAVGTAGGDLLLDVLTGIVSLVDKSLLKQVEGADGEPRFLMLETIREYAWERLEQSGELDVVRAAYAAHYLAVAEAAHPKLRGSEQLAWLARLEQEHANLRAVLTWSQAAPERLEVGLQLARSLIWFWQLRGHVREGLSWLTNLLEHSGPAQRSVVYARALFAAGHLTRGNPQRAKELYEASLTLSQDLGDRWNTALVMRDLGYIVYFLGDTERGVALIEACLPVFQELGDTAGYAEALNDLASVTSDRGDSARAVELLDESLVYYQKLGDRRGSAEILCDRGRLALDQGQCKRALAWFEEARVLYLDLADRIGYAWCLTFLGRAEQQQGDYRNVRTRYEEALGLFEEVADQEGSASTLQLLGELAREQGQIDHAIQLITASLTLRQEVNDTDAITWILNSLGDIALDQGDYPRATTLYQESLALCEQLRNNWCKALVLCNLGRAAYIQGDDGGAARLYQESIKQSEQLGARLFIGRALTGLARLVLRQGDKPRAAVLYRQSLAEFQESHQGLDIIRYLEGVAGLAGTAAQATRAIQLLGAAEAVRQAIGAPLRADEQVDYERRLATVRPLLSETSFTAAWAGGQVLSSEQAIAEAVAIIAEHSQQ